MSDIIPAPRQAPSLLTPFSTTDGASFGERLKEFFAQPPVRRAVPWFAGVAAIGLTALTWSAFMPGNQRILYSALEDAERATVTTSLDKASIGYSIDPTTGALSVSEADLYKARMIVASDGAIAAPETSASMMDKLPMGASRTLEADRLRSALEQDLVLSITEIDGVETARVRIAQAEKSVFVREDTPSSASVMLRLVKGRQLTAGQVSAIRNLVASAVPAMTTDAVQVVDQNGKLLSQPDTADTDRIALQSRIEEKIRGQIDKLLRPIAGQDGFSSEVQIELDLDETSSARESYEKDGVVRSETQQQSQSSGQNAIGVPGVLSNTPPPQAVAQLGVPTGTTAQATGSGTGESNSSRTYELGRQVTVSNTQPGRIKRLTVAVALNSALKNMKAADVEQIKQLVNSAVGADPERGDQITVVRRAFNPDTIQAPAFYESSWFGMLVRYSAGLIVILLLIFLVIRPLIGKSKDRMEDEDADGKGLEILPSTRSSLNAGSTDTALLERQIGLAQQAVNEKPDNAMLALRQMLDEAKANPV